MCRREIRPHHAGERHIGEERGHTQINLPIKRFAERPWCEVDTCVLRRPLANGDAQEITGERIAGRVEGIGDFEGFLTGAAGRQGLSRATLHANGQPVLLASGTFMVLEPPPGVAMHPIVSADHTAIQPLAESALTAPERELLARVEAALANITHDTSFIERLWGYHPRRTPGGAICVVANGPHLGNRVGHMQGGLQLGLAASTANAALPTGWMLSGISAYFISPGEGRTLRAASRLVHRGRHTAVVRTVITGKQRRRILEVVSTHAWCGHRE